MDLEKILFGNFLHKLNWLVLVPLNPITVSFSLGFWAAIYLATLIVRQCVVCSSVHHLPFICLWNLYDSSCIPFHFRIRLHLFTSLYWILFYGIWYTLWHLFWITVGTFCSLTGFFVDLEFLQCVWRLLRLQSWMLNNRPDYLCLRFQ